VLDHCRVLVGFAAEAVMEAGGDGRHGRLLDDAVVAAYAVLNPYIVRERRVDAQLVSRLRLALDRILAGASGGTPTAAVAATVPMAAATVPMAAPAAPPSSGSARTGTRPSAVGAPGQRAVHAGDQRGVWPAACAPQLAPSAMQRGIGGSELMHAADKPLASPPVDWWAASTPVWSGQMLAAPSPAVDTLLGAPTAHATRDGVGALVGSRRGSAGSASHAYAAADLCGLVAFASPASAPLLADVSRVPRGLQRATSARIDEGRAPPLAAPSAPASAAPPSQWAARAAELWDGRASQLSAEQPSAASAGHFGGAPGSAAVDAGREELLQRLLRRHAEKRAAEAAPRPADAATASDDDTLHPDGSHAAARGSHFAPGQLQPSASSAELPSATRHPVAVRSTPAPPQLQPQHGHAGERIPGTREQTPGEWVPSSQCEANAAAADTLRSPDRSVLPEVAEYDRFLQDEANSGQVLWGATQTSGTNVTPSRARHESHGIIPSALGGQLRTAGLHHMPAMASTGDLFGNLRHFHSRNVRANIGNPIHSGQDMDSTTLPGTRTDAAVEHPPEHASKASSTALDCNERGATAAAAHSARLQPATRTRVPRPTAAVAPRSSTGAPLDKASTSSHAVIRPAAIAVRRTTTERRDSKATRTSR
jgi:hypothetical protein